MPEYIVYLPWCDIHFKLTLYVGFCYGLVLDATVALSVACLCILEWYGVFSGNLDDLYEEAFYAAPLLRHQKNTSAL